MSDLEQAKYAIRESTRAIREYHENGKPVAVCEKRTGKWAVTSSPTWDWDKYYYRPVK